MSLIADLHVHSRFSRATSKLLDFEPLYIAAQLKGITVLATGDATHPEWVQNIKDKLSPAEPGLYRLRPSLARDCDALVPASCRSTVRFLLVSEISNIYKKDGKTRKNHNLVFMPSLEAAERFNGVLDRVGNIRSDGRPILGLDARDLLEIVLETDPAAFLVPAHIWTPWFSLLGSKSGFDSLDACFGDLFHEIFAVETGLSSDPPMNRMVSDLDRLTLISNSDAHSPAKIGREANIFHTALDFHAMRDAMRSGHPDQFGGTIEFYPEEGKYHLDGHRKCGVRLTPEESRACDGVCPGCGKPLTIGVLNRVEALADRRIQDIPARFPPHENLIPLHDILSEILAAGPATKTVEGAYQSLVGKLGSEFQILRQLQPEVLDRAGLPLLSEAVTRMRSGRVCLSAGYDGEFGRVRLFGAGERQRILGQRHLFSIPVAKPISVRRRTPKAHLRTASQHAIEAPSPPPAIAAFVTNREQQQAVMHEEGPLMIVAGPGTGKTATLTRRIARLIQDRGLASEKLLAITFTEKAAREMRSRLESVLEAPHRPPLTATFHALCWQLICEEDRAVKWQLLDEDDRLVLLNGILRRMQSEGLKTVWRAAQLQERIENAKQNLQGPEDFFESVAAEAGDSQFARAYREYQTILERNDWLDYDDLLGVTVKRLERDAAYRDALRRRFEWVFVDEYQDLNGAQYRLIRALVPAPGNICVIGDPDQAIYGFRGSDARYFNRFAEDYPGAAVIHLKRNYRSTETILRASWQVIRQAGLRADPLYSEWKGKALVTVIESASARAEAVAIGKIIESQLGGRDFLAVDAGRDSASLGLAGERSLSEFAVLFRTAAQAEVIAEALYRAGIPYQLASRREAWAQGPMAGILSLLRLLSGCATHRDLYLATQAAFPKVDAGLLDRFLDWSTGKGLPLNQALPLVKQQTVPGMSAARQRRLADFAANLGALQSATKMLPLGALLDRLEALTEGQSTEARAEAFKRLRETAPLHAGSVGEFAAGLALQQDADTLRHDVERVSLMTMHSAKGLEFPVVFVAGCEEGLIPIERPGGGTGDPEEERRLFYVAMTRAREQLFCSWARHRHLYGKTLKQRISPFVNDIQKQLRAHLADQAAERNRQRQIQLKLF